RTPPATLYTLSLHDALPICLRTDRRCTRKALRVPRRRVRAAGSVSPRAGPSGARGARRGSPARLARRRDAAPAPTPLHVTAATRSEEHTSELQSRGHLVCRL